MFQVLIVDDELQNIEWLKILLEEDGFAVVTACDGVEALTRARDDKPDLVISDILMPVMDGFTFCRALKADETLRHIPFIFFTANYGDSRDEELANKLGAARFLKKPLSPDDILQNIHEVLERPSRIEEQGFGGRNIDDDLFLRSYSNIISAKLAEKVSLLKELDEKQDLMQRSLHTILEISVDAIISVDKDRNITVWSTGAEVLFGYKREGMLGRSIEVIVPENRRREAADMANAVRRWGYLRGLETERLTKDGRLIDVEMSVMELGAEFGTTAIVKDISLRKIANREIKQNLETLKKAFEGTIEAMAVTVETRDPYTAGHQKRVTALAGAIARKMGLDNNLVDGIRMASMIHDLGKISVPAEILSKPGKISEMEFAIIKSHPQIGYDILKNIEFPWPIAKIVLQHHERYDGSGYPAGLSGKECLMEAKILVVADVVEAMAAHRPYRPAFGIDAALEEIFKNRDILYDPIAADACIKICSTKEFTLENS